MKSPRAFDSDNTGVVPPSTVTVFEVQPKPVLYLPDGRVMVRKPAGYDTGKR